MLATRWTHLVLVLSIVSVCWGAEPEPTVLGRVMTPGIMLDGRPLTHGAALEGSVLLTTGPELGAVHLQTGQVLRIEPASAIRLNPGPKGTLDVTLVRGAASFQTKPTGVIALAAGTTLSLRDPSGKNETLWRKNAGDGHPGDDPDKVCLCHIPPGNPDNAHTVCVGSSAVQAHFDHGDTMGACQSMCGDTFPECGGTCPDGFFPFCARSDVTGDCVCAACVCLDDNSTDCNNCERCVCV